MIYNQSMAGTDSRTSSNGVANLEPSCDFDVALCMEERFAAEGVADGKAQGALEGTINGLMDGIKDSYSFGEKVGSVLAKALNIIDGLNQEKAAQVELLASKLITAINSPMSESYLEIVMQNCRNLERRIAIMTLDFELKYLDVSSSEPVGLSSDAPLTLGRGKVGSIEIDDRRISRNHAELSIASHQLFIKANHSNPCFIFKSTDKKHRVVLHRNESLRLEIGDTVRLLPDAHSFLVCLPSSDNSSQSQSNPNNVFSSPAATGSNTGAKRKLPAWMTNSAAKAAAATNDDIDDVIDSPTKQPARHVASSNPVTSISQMNDSQLQSTQAYDYQNDDGSDTGPCTCSADVKAEPTDVSISIKPDPSPSKDSKGTIEPDRTNNNPGASTSATTNQPPSQTAQQRRTSSSSSAEGTKQRLPCSYGRSCYRKNPLHFAQFCHPGDAEYESASNASSTGDGSVLPQSCQPCKYGMNCYRKNPQHWIEYSHPKPPPSFSNSASSSVSSSAPTRNTRNQGTAPIPYSNIDEDDEELGEEEDEDEEAFEDDDDDGDYEQPAVEDESDENGESQGTDKTSSTDIVEQSDDDDDAS